MYKIGQKEHPAAASWVDEWTRAGAGGAVVVGSNPAQSMIFFFFFRSQKISMFFGGLVTGTPSANFPVLVPVL